ncbi:MAG: phosphoglycolate phosphatase-like HAD superfamily hydrolase [Planctomycetota bacterium]|jgi:phosphoglycolate phosphatase-like HAD superfamily hydrolase/ADP-ribose pyrophosphatase YjhB (NUDIX family)
MIESLIFDWSGTLADDFDATLAATNETLLALGGSAVDRETYRRDFVIPVMGFYESRLPGRTLAEIDAVFFAAMKAQPQTYSLFPGAKELLATAKSRGKKIFILSTMSTELLVSAAKELGVDGFIDGIYGDASDKSQVMPRLLSENELQADRTVFAGDTPHDIEVGRASGVCLAASVYGYTSEEKMRLTRPDYVMHDLLDLGRALDRDHMIDTQKLVIATVGGLVERTDGKILVVRTKKWSNTFGIPGGKIDYGETMLEAYVREMKEETGLDLDENHFVMIQDCIESTEFVKPRHFLLINYFSRTSDHASLMTNYEIEESKWVTPEEAFELKLNEPTRLALLETAKLGFIDIGKNAK